MARPRRQRREQRASGRQYEKTLAAQENFAEQFGADSRRLDLGSQRAFQTISEKVSPEFEVLGVDTAEAIVKAFRERAAKPIEVPIVDRRRRLGDSPTCSTSASALRLLEGSQHRGGININVEKMVAQDYADMQRQLRQRTQQAGLGGRPAA